MEQGLVMAGRRQHFMACGDIDGQHEVFRCATLRVGLVVHDEALQRTLEDAARTAHFVVKARNGIKGLCESCSAPGDPRTRSSCSDSLAKKPQAILIFMCDV